MVAFLRHHVYIISADCCRRDLASIAVSTIHRPPVFLHPYESMLYYACIVNTSLILQVTQQGSCSYIEMLRLPSHFSFRNSTGPKCVTHRDVRLTFRENAMFKYTCMFRRRSRLFIRPHRGTMQRGAAYCHRRSSVVCQSVGLSVCHDREPCKNRYTDRDVVWFMDSGGPKEPCIRLGFILKPTGEHDWTVHVRRRCGLLSDYFDRLLFFSSDGH